MKHSLLAACALLALSSVAHAGSTPVVSGVPVVITTTITISPPSADVTPGGVPVFFTITPPSVPGGPFTFRLSGS